MIAVDIGPHPDYPDAYAVFKGPPSMGDDCGDLAVRLCLVEGENGPYQALVSEWRPSQHELDLINKGEPIRLSVMGNSLPPLALWVRGQSEI